MKIMTTEIAQRPQMAVATIDTVRQFLTSKGVQESLKHGLQGHMTPDRMCRLILTAVQKTPKLMECFNNDAGKRSVGLAMLTAGQIGLEIDGRHAHLVPFKNKGGYMEAVCIFDYKGLIKLAYNNPRVCGIWADEIRRNDQFSYQRGSSPRIEHIIPIEADRGDLIGSYACCEISGSKNPVFVVMTATDIARIRSSSRGADDPSSPWQTAEGQMWIKSALRQLSKVIPQSAELERALAVEDEFESTGSVKNSLTIDVSAQPEVKFAKSLPNALPPEQLVSGPGEAATAQTPGESPVQAPTEAVVEPTPRKKREPKVTSSQLPTAPVETAIPAQNQAPVTTAPVTPPAATATGLKTLDQEVAEFYMKEAKAGFSEVMKTMARLNPKWHASVKAKSFAEMTMPELNALYGGRPGIVREVLRDARDAMKASTTAPA